MTTQTTTKKQWQIIYGMLRGRECQMAGGGYRPYEASDLYDAGLSRDTVDYAEWIGCLAAHQRGCGQFSAVRYQARVGHCYITEYVARLREGYRVQKAAGQRIIRFPR